MGKKRRRRSSGQPGGFWRQEYGGAPMWFIAVAVVAILGFGAVGVSAMAQQPTADTSRPMQPAPTFTYGTPAPARPVAVFIGDSYTAGAGSTTGAGFVAGIASAQGWKAVNIGKGGTGYITTGEAQDPANAQNACGLDYCPNYGEVIQDAVAADPSIVVVSGGRNNSWASASLVDEHVTKFFTELRAALPNARIIATSPLWDDDPAPAIMEQIAESVKSAVVAVGGEYVDLGQPLLGDSSLVSSDGVHPNDAGYARIVDAFDAALPSS